MHRSFFPLALAIFVSLSNGLADAAGEGLAFEFIAAKPFQVAEKLFPASRYFAKVHTHFFGGCSTTVSNLYEINSPVSIKSACMYSKTAQLTATVEVLISQSGQIVEFRSPDSIRGETLVVFLVLPREQK
jgi:hypothetical protein